MRILALDLAKSTGWAALDDDGHIVTGNERFHGPAFHDIALAYRQTLLALLKRHRPELVAYEAPVVRHPHASKILIGLSWITILTCCELNIPCIPISNTAAKKHWVGRTYSKKEQPYPGLIEAQRRGFTVRTTDEADALAILHFARDNRANESGGGAASARQPAQRKRRLSRDRRTTRT